MPESMYLNKSVSDAMKMGKKMTKRKRMRSYIKGVGAVKDGQSRLKAGPGMRKRNPAGESGDVASD